MVEKFTVEHRFFDDIGHRYLGAIGLFERSPLSKSVELGYVFVCEGAPCSYFFSDKLLSGLVVGGVGEFEDF